MLDRARLVLLVAALVACKAAPATMPSTADQGSIVTAADGSRCTTPAGANANAERESCAAKGADCRYVRELTCRGVDVGDEQRELERRAAEAGRVPCACVCPADIDRCAEVP
jgi:hypothetical protein